MERAAHRGLRHNLALAQSFNLKQAQCRMTTSAAQARYPLTQGVNPWLVTLAVMLPTFMEVLDTAIASVALPYIAGSLSASTSEATWVLTSYLVAWLFLPLRRSFAGRQRRWRRLCWPELCRAREAERCNRCRNRFCWKAFRQPSARWAWPLLRWGLW
jgi:hypothetical protein